MCPHRDPLSLNSAFVRQEDATTGSVFCFGFMYLRVCWGIPGHNCNHYRWMWVSHIASFSQSTADSVEFRRFQCTWAFSALELFHHGSVLLCSVVHKLACVHPTWLHCTHAKLEHCRTADLSFCWYKSFVPCDSSWCHLNVTWWQVVAFNVPIEYQE